MGFMPDNFPCESELKSMTAQQRVDIEHQFIEYYKRYAFMSTKIVHNDMYVKEKKVTVIGKNGKPKERNGSSPIRESVVNIKPDTTMADLQKYTEKVHQRWGVRAIQIHIHKDEGHYTNPDDPSTWQPNLHQSSCTHHLGLDEPRNGEVLQARQERYGRATGYGS